MEGVRKVKEPSPLLIKRIWQKNNHTFCIEWHDHHIGEYRLSDLQKKCPCAACLDATSGKRLNPENTVREDVRAQKVVSVGRYALRIFFTTGCSNGIYDFALLRNL
jgi:DUF971 family protein